MGIFKEVDETISKMEAAQFKRTIDSTELFSRDGKFYFGKWAKWRRAGKPEADRLLAEFRAEHPDAQ